MLNPVEALKSEIYSVEGKHICLSGNFEFKGQKPAVEKFIIERGGIIDSNVKKTTDYLVIGACECQAYSNGTYGTKVKKAIEYNDKGCNIQIIKETDFLPTFNKSLFFVYSVPTIEGALIGALFSVCLFFVYCGARVDVCAGYSVPAEMIKPMREFCSSSADF